MSACACLTCGPRRSRWNDKEIEATRRKLAREWRQKVDQVTEEEAEWHLNGRPRREH